MIIEELHLQLFKGFRDFNLECSQFTVLVGRNNSGKTSILQAIQLLHAVFVFAFGNSERPDFSNPQWASNPRGIINRVSSGDPEAIWLHKRTSEPCEISAKLSGNIEVHLKISGLGRYDLDLLRDGQSVKTELTDPQNESLIEEIFALRPTYVPPVGAVSPTEHSLDHPAVVERVDGGRTAECWRNVLDWRWNDGRKEDFDEMVETVRRYLPEATIRPPRRSHDRPPRILIEFEEEETAFDISMSGGGLLTLLNLAFVLQFSNSKCLLLDEPDAHLHASLQREIAEMLMDHATENDVQVFVATHSPTFIGECPVESLVWIDRNEQKGGRCTDTGLVLIDLGAITHADAIRARGADKILFVEGSLDRRILGHLLSLSGRRNPFDDQSVIKAKLPNGKGDRKHLAAFQKLLPETFGVAANIACITDNDYDLGHECEGANSGESEPLLLALRRKEIENYLLDPAVIVKAAKDAAEEREKRTGRKACVPTVEETGAEMRRILEDPDIRDSVKYQVRPRHRDSLARRCPGLDKSTQEQKADEWFDRKWSDDEWRMRNCPGKHVVRRLKKWCKDKFSITLTDSKLIEAMEKCPDDVLEIAEKLQSHFYGQAGR